MSPIHVLASSASDFVPLRRRNANFDLWRRVLCGPAQGKQSGREPWERFAQAKRKFWPPETRFVWPCAGKTVRPSGSRRRNANFELPRWIFCGPAQAKRKFWPPETRRLSRSCGFTRSRDRMNEIATALQRDAKKNSKPRFRAGETQILTSGVAFFVALRSKKRGGQKKAPRPKRLYPYRKNPSVWHTVWGKKTMFPSYKTSFFFFRSSKNRCSKAQFQQDIPRAQLVAGRPGLRVDLLQDHQLWRQRRHPKAHLTKKPVVSPWKKYLVLIYPNQPFNRPKWVKPCKTNIYPFVFLEN